MNEVIAIFFMCLVRIEWVKFSYQFKYESMVMGALALVAGGLVILRK